MKQLLWLFVLCIVYSLSSFPIIRRGNLFQQLMFLSGIPLHESFYKLIMRVFFVNKLIHSSTNCSHIIYCSRTEYCSEICKAGTVSTTPQMQFAIRTQSTLSTLSNFCEHQSIGTHNSAITAAYGYGVEDRYYSLLLSSFYLQFNQVRTVSQYYSLTDQLNMGVRHIELDIHFFHNQLRISHCGFSIGLINYLFYLMEWTLKPFHFLYDTETIGCLPSFNGIPAEDQLLLESILIEIAEWLDQPRNRYEMIILYLDISSNLHRWKKETMLAELFLHSFSSLLLFPNSTSSLQDNILQNHRVMVVTRQPLSIPSSFFFSVESPTCCWWHEEDIKTFCYSSGEVKPSSEAFAGKTGESIYYTRVVTNQLRYGPLSKDFLPFPSPVNLHTNNTHSLYELGVNSLAVDYIEPSQVNEHLWLWDKTLNWTSLLKTYYNSCVVMRDHMWNVVPCKETHAVLCQHEFYHDRFIIGNRISNPQLFLPSLYTRNRNRNNNMSFCPYGFLFKPPINLRQMRFARQVVLQNETVWIAFRLEDYYFL